LWAAIRKEWWWQLLAYIGLLTAGLLLGHWSWMRSAIITGLGLIATVCAVVLIVQHLRMGSSSHPVSILLRHDPQFITWIYSVRTQRMPFGIELFSSATIYFHLADGDCYSLSLPSGVLKLVSHTLNRYLPHATFGYSREMAHRFQDPPGQL
jgi:hypothetical protein